MKGIYNKHSILPRYVNIWDINVLLLAYNSIEKLTALLVILSEQQKQILLAIHIDNVSIHEDNIIILPNSSIKHTNWINVYKPQYITIPKGTLHVV